MKLTIPAVAAIAASAALIPAAGASAAGSGGVTGPAIFVDGSLYRTVGTPTDFSGTGAPASSYQTIYDLGGAQPNVADAGPGQPGFRGGRWLVRPVLFRTSYATTLMARDANGSGTLDSNEEIEAALADAGPGGADLGGVVKSFECPLIKVPAARR